MRDEAGSAAVEFTLVGVLLTVLTLAVIQLGLTLHVRTTVLDAAAEGARFGALADNSPADGASRTAALIAEALGPGFDASVRSDLGQWRDHPTVIVTVRTTLPLLGLLGAADALEVAGHAAIEELD